MSTVHHLKCWPAFFDATARGDKPFDVRRDDRAYQAGDTVYLQRFDPETGLHTGDILDLTISFVLRGGQFGIEPGFVVLGFWQASDPPHRAMGR